MAGNHPTDDVDPRLVRNVRSRALPFVAIAAVLSAVAIGDRRRRTLRDGDCTSAGPWDCGYDGTTALVIAFVIGVAMVLVVGALVRLTRIRYRRAGAVAVVAVVAAWSALVVALFVGAGEL